MKIIDVSDKDVISSLEINELVMEYKKNKERGFESKVIYKGDKMHRILRFTRVDAFCKLERLDR